MIDEKLKNEIIEFVQKADRPVTLDELKTSFKLDAIENLKSEINAIEELVCIPFDFGFSDWQIGGVLEFIYYKLAILPRLSVVEFIRHDIESQLRIAKRELSIVEISLNLKNDFLEYFGVYEGSAPDYDDYPYYELYNSASWKFIDLIGGEDKLVSIISSYHAFYLDYRSTFDLQFIYVGLKEWKSYSIKNLLSDEEIIRSKAVSILKNAENSEMSLRDLTFRLSTYPFKISMPKPFKSEYIEQIILQDPVNFNFQPIEEKVLLNNIDQINRLKKIDLTGKWIFDAGYIKYDKYSNLTGVLSIKFVGDFFPIPQFQEYIKLRPHIYLFTTNNLFGVLSKIYYSGIQEKGTLQSSDVERLLKKFIPDINNMSWFKDNFEIYFLLEGSESLYLTYKELIKKLIPIFNVHDNPGNIFELAVKDMMKEADGK